MTVPLLIKSHRQLRGYVAMIKRRKPFSYYFKKGSYYEQILSEYESTDQYLKIFDQTHSLNCLETDTVILPKILEGTIKTVISSFGKPHFCSVLKDTTIFIYKWKLNNMKIRCTIHFHRKEVFLINHNYLISSQKEKEFVTKSILLKYAPSFGSCILSEYKITDKNQNFFFINESQGLSVNYFKNEGSGWHKNMYIEFRNKLNAIETMQLLKQQQYFSLI